MRIVLLICFLLLLLDLKLHRKVKEYERQQWKEETKKKIFLKQRQSLIDLMNDDLNENSSPNIAPPDSVVKIKIKCVPDTDSNENIKLTEKFVRPCRRKQSPSPQRREQKKVIELTRKSRRENKIVDESIRPKKIEKPKPNVVETAADVPLRTFSAPELSQKVPRRARSKSAASDPAGQKECPKNASRSSSRSRPKSCNEQ